jgi:hypothetical protein
MSYKSEDERSVPILNPDEGQPSSCMKKIGQETGLDMSEINWWMYML